MQGDARYDVLAYAVLACSWLLVVLVVVAVAQRRLGPSSSATTSTMDRALPSLNRYAHSFIFIAGLVCA